MRNKNAFRQRGHIVLIGIVFFAIMLALLAVFLQHAAMHARISRVAVADAQALQLAEAGVDAAVAKLNQDISYAGESNSVLGEGMYSVTVATVDAQTRLVTSSGTATFKGRTTTKTVRATVGIDNTVISFRYGVQAGNGGFVMSGGATINGNVYSNGNINATTGVVITGSAVAANQPAVSADQVNDSPSPIPTCASSSCVTFGNANASQDFAQSFRLSQAVPLNNMQFYLRKVGNPGNVTVRIVIDNSGAPSGSQLMSGTLSSSAVTANFGWVTVTMPSNPVLDPSQSYWMVLDGNSNASNYYVIGANADGYSNGSARIGRHGSSWVATSPANLDGYFRIFLGGGYSMIGGNSYVTGVYVGTAPTDDAWAHTVMGATVSGSLYCQTSSYTNKPCDMSRSDPAPQPMPLSDNNISDWKSEAEAGGTITGNYTVGWAGATLGPRRITGNLVVEGGGILTVTGTLWVEGNIQVSGGGEIHLDSSYGSNSGAIVADGYVRIEGGSDFAGSGSPGSYPFVITTSACPAAPNCNGNDAITLSGGAGTVALVAQNGNARINGGSSLKAVTAKQVTMSGGATLHYDSGLVNENFNSGPGGSWVFIPGTYSVID